MSKEIEEIIAGKDTPVADTPKVEAPPKEEKPTEAKPPDKPEAKNEPVLDQAPPDDGGVSDSGPDVSRQIAGLKAAQTAERKKRQDLEAASAKRESEWQEKEAWYKQQFERFNTQPPAPKQPDVPKPSLFENPEDWEKHVVGGAVQSMDQKLAAQNFRFSEMLARRTYKDEFGEAEKWAEAQVRSNPAHPIRQVLAASNDPGETLVQEFRKSKILADMSDPIAWRQKLLDEMLADPDQKKMLLERLGAEPLKPANPQQPAPSALPSNLAGARSLGGSKGPVWQGPKPLGEIISGNSKR